MKLTVFATMTFSFLLASTSAQAASITNMTKEKQFVEIETADGYDSVEIEPNRTFGVVGDMKGRYNGKDFRIEDNMLYSIWPNNVLGPQKKQRQSTR